MTNAAATALTIRPATRDDLADIARIMNDPPEPPAAALLGRDTATRLGSLFVHAGISISLSQTRVAVVDGRVVGVMECGHRDGSKLTPFRVLRLARAVLRAVWIIGPRGLLRAIRGYRRRAVVSFKEVSVFPVAELYVDEQLRNRGIGGALLAHADELAMQHGARRMCIETGITNPARRLYERNGYHVVDVKTDAEYERLTRSPGRVLMVKELSALRASSATRSAHSVAPASLT
jgi:GNAT superfamily N-acetyltransferase